MGFHPPHPPGKSKDEQVGLRMLIVTEFALNTISLAPTPVHE